MSRQACIILLYLMVPLCFKAYPQEFIPAIPRGGERQLKDFINEEIMYPENALKAGKQGIVIVAVDVSEEGIPCTMRIEQGVCPELDAEALRILKYILFQPAVYRGKNVKSVTRIEVPFSVKKYKKIVRKRGYEYTMPPTCPVDTSGKVYAVKDLDVAPQPIAGGKSVNLGQFIARNFKYPDEALRKSISGTVQVNFIIEPHGRCSNVMALNTIGAGCTEESVRLIKMLHWKPGMVNGKAVRTNVTIPVTFSLPDGTNFKSPQSPGGTTLY